MSRNLLFVRWCTLALAMLIAGFAATPVSAAATGCLPGALKSKLSQIRAKFGPIRIVSTHRPGARIAGTGKRSYHSSCRAVDFHPPKGKYRQVVSWLKTNHAGGVGTYSCGMRHIHIDNGARVRFHKCVNGRGQRINSKKKRRYAKKRNRKYAKRSKRNARYKKKRRARAYAAKRKRVPRVQAVRSFTMPRS